MTIRPGLIAAALAFSAAAAENDAPIVHKVFLPPRLHIGNTGIILVQPIDEAAWIWHPEFENVSATPHADVFSGGWRKPVLLRFRKQFEATASAVRIHVSAEERFELFLDGRRIAGGPDRSDVEHWSYATYDLGLAPGNHRLEALVWSIGPYAPVAQMSWRGGFVLKADAEYDPQLTTGKSAWEVAKLDGYDFAPGVFFVGAQLITHDCGAQWKEGDYVKAQVIRPPLQNAPYGESAAGWKLFPTTLPDQLDREITTGHAVASGTGALGTDDPIRAEHARHPILTNWQAVIDGKEPFVVPPKTDSRRLSGSAHRRPIPATAPTHHPTAR